MNDRLEYDPIAKLLHWLVVALLLVQFPLGWLMPDVRGGKPGASMTLHVSLGIAILVLTALRLVWKITHWVASESALPYWQRLTSTAVHWLLYALALATTITGWVFVSFRGWSLSLFNAVPLPMLASQSAAATRMTDGWHQFAEWALLGLVALHVAAAMAHMLIYRDGVMQRILPNRTQVT